MELPLLLESLIKPEAYPFTVDDVRVHQTHISVVFLAGDKAYKIKKPVRTPYLDFSTLEKRHHFCSEEVRLNRRLAPEVYEAVVPVGLGPEGPRFEGEGPIVEWAVRMKRLPVGVTLLERLQNDTLDVAQVIQTAHRVVDFHATHPAPRSLCHYARAGELAEQIFTLLDGGIAQVGISVAAGVLGRLRGRFEAELARHVGTLNARAERGVPREAHGDLHLDHVCFFPDGNLAIIDGIEFNEALRYLDPVADLAFLSMDLQFHGRTDLARVFNEAAFARSGDVEGQSLLPLFAAYRAAVRGLVHGQKAAEAEVPEAERRRAQQISRGYWLLALALIEDPQRCPCLVLFGGLPGSGKSTLARLLAESTGANVLRTDVIRKELAGAALTEPLPESGYSPSATEQTYAVCLERAEALLSQGRRVFVDATFRREEHRRLFLDLATRLGLPAVGLECRANPETVRQRLDARRGDASDANKEVATRLAAEWQDPGPKTQRCWHVLSTEGTPGEAVARAQTILHAVGLAL